MMMVAEMLAVDGHGAVHDALPQDTMTRLELAARLADAFDQAGVFYCHWKSNYALDRALKGEDDLDLLVERRSLTAALETLAELGFKPATVNWGPRVAPGIYHFYGLDLPSMRILHVHLFARVLTGESFIKSHCLPLDTMLLGNSDTSRLFPTPTRTAELGLFIVRTFIKYGSLLDIVYLRRESASLEAELRWLSANSDLHQAAELVAHCCPTLEPAYFKRCVGCLEANDGLVRRYLLARGLRRRLKSFRRHTAGGRLLTYAHLLTSHVLRKLLGKKNKSLCSGGAVVAIVGPEATGKSTLVLACRSWLGRILSIQQVHAGKPPPYWLLRPMNLLLPWLRRYLPMLRSSRVEGQRTAIAAEGSQAAAGTVFGALYAFRSLTTAWDRRRLLVRMAHAAAHGDIVICDRYPSDVVGAMDSRRLRAEPVETGLLVRLYNACARLEAKIYKDIPPPQIVLQLKVSLSIAKQRNHARIKANKESDAYVEARHLKAQRWRAAAAECVIEIDTSGSLEETVATVRRLIWEEL